MLEEKSPRPKLGPAPGKQAGSTGRPAVPVFQQMSKGGQKTPGAQPGEAALTPLPVQRQHLAASHPAVNPFPNQAAPNNTGLPDNLKAGIENLSGFAMDDVKVHYNSAKPAQLQAHAYAQGTDIHLAPGQEKHLPHEAWHVAQQKQGRVKPTLQMKGVAINDDGYLEKEADTMGGKALRQNINSNSLKAKMHKTQQVQRSNNVQLTKIHYTSGLVEHTEENGAKQYQLVGKKMVAELDVKNALRGTATGQQWTWMRSLRNIHRSAAVVRGHLLNHDLGGRGVAENLYPISAAANKQHSENVENKVKHLLNKQGSLAAPGTSSSPATSTTLSTPGASSSPATSIYKLIEYNVTVKEAKAGHYEDAAFECEWGLTGGPKQTHTVKSDLKNDTGGAYAPIPSADKADPHPSWKRSGPSKVYEFWGMEDKNNKKHDSVHDATFPGGNVTHAQIVLVADGPALPKEDMYDEAVKNFMNTPTYDKAIQSAVKTKLLSSPAFVKELTEQYISMPPPAESTRSKVDTNDKYAKELKELFDAAIKDNSL